MRPEFFFSNYFRDAISDDAQNLRNNALKIITKYEWPKFRKSEFWKYTNPDAFFKGIENKSDKDLELPLLDVDDYLIEDAINILDTEDGFLVRDALPKGVTVSSILDFPKKLENESGIDSSLSNKKLTHSVVVKAINKKETENMLLLNQSYLNSGFYLKLDDNVNLDVPIQIIHTKGDKHVFRKNIIEVGKFTKATVIETYVSSNDLNLFFSMDTDVLVGDNSNLSHYKLELSNSSDRIFNNVNINVNRDAFYNNFYFTNGGSKIKNNIVLNLLAEGSQTELNGLYLLKDKNHVDNSSSINHVKPNTISRQLYKGLLKDNSEATFNGLVEIFKDAKQSDSNQLNQNMLLSENATINSKPQLVIGNDDVKCSHGSTTGQMDANQLFYLQSRGMSKEEGAKLLSKAFVTEVLAKIKEDEVRSFLINIINKEFWS